MTKAAFFGYLFLSCGPPLAVGLPFFWHRAFLSLTVITSMFAWLLIMIVTSMLFRGFVPLRSDVGPYSAMLVVTVLLEELARVGLWFVHTFSSRKLRDLAHTGYVRYDDQDELSLAYSIGWGHGFLHLLMQFLPFLPLTWHAPTVYSPECSQMSAFLVSCLSQLGFFAILAGGHVVFIYGIKFRVWPYAAAVPLLHFGASLLTLLNLRDDGCTITVPLLLCAGLLTGALAAWLMWQTGMKRQPLMSVQHSNPLAAR